MCVCVCVWTYELLAIVVDEELLQLEVPVVSPLQDTVAEEGLAHVAAPWVLVAGAVGHARAHQDVQTVHTETPAHQETR